MAKTTSSSSSAPWREGRVSFKGYRIEFFLLILFTLACVVCAFVWSNSVVKRERKQTQTNSTSFVVPSSFAFAQDASINQVADSGTAKASSTGDSHVASSSSSGSKLWLKILAIWCVCLIPPLVLWIWRGWVWFSTIFGLKYELRCDADNPRATTFLITRGIFQKRTDSMHIGQIVDIHSEQSIIQKYLLGGIGNIVLHTNDATDPTVNMKNLDEPNRVFNAFDELRRHYWGRGGVQLNQGGVEDLGGIGDVGA